MENNIERYLFIEVYRVETENGQKHIHIDGYCYKADDDLKLVTFTFCIIKLCDINGSMDKVDELEEEVKQHIKDNMTDEEVLDYYKDKTCLPIVEVTEDTPDGWYINTKDEDKQEENEEDCEEAEEEEAKSEETEVLTPAQQIIYDYLQERAKNDDTIALNLQKQNKSIKKCWEYIVSQARKAATGNCAMIADEVVFGWAVHYYDEDNIETDKKPAPKAKAVKIIVPEKTEVKKERFIQCDLFGELGM